MLLWLIPSLADFHILNLLHQETYYTRYKMLYFSAPPKDHNIYIENVLETVLEPVLEGVGKLKQTVQLSVISQATEALCQAWMNFILNEKIKFR